MVDRLVAENVALGDAVYNQGNIQYQEQENKYIGKAGSAARDQYEHELSMGILGHKIKKQDRNVN